MRAAGGTATRSPAKVPRTRAACTTTAGRRSEEHTSELQSLTNLVCRLLLEKKNPPSRAGTSASGRDDSALVKAPARCASVAINRPATPRHNGLNQRE